MFEVEEDLDLEVRLSAHIRCCRFPLVMSLNRRVPGVLVPKQNTRYVSDEGQSAGDDSIEDPEVLRAAGTPGDNVGTLDFNLLGGGSISAMLPEATHPTKTLEADAEDEHEAAGDFPPREETPSARSLDLDVQQGYTPGVLPGDTPGNELAVVGDTPEGTAQRHSADDDDVYEDFEAPELGNSGLVSADAPWGTSSSHLHGQSAHQRSRKHEVKLVILEALVSAFLTSRATLLKVDVDDGADGRPGKEMPGASIRSLLLDRAPLLTNRGFRGGVNTKQDKKVTCARPPLQACQVLVPSDSAACGTVGQEAKTLAGSEFDAETRNTWSCWACALWSLAICHICLFKNQSWSLEGSKAFRSVFKSTAADYCGGRAAVGEWP